ncbi:MAG: anion permease [Acidobacteria bacterium]|nr:anion permease [Acidobacteriota bacterium]MCA1636748.1 anion permease [Acidobacteriota bacterium]
MAGETKNFENTSLWAQIDARLAESDKQSDGTGAFSARGFRWVVDAILPISMTIVVGIGVMLPESLTREARIALFCFALATILWSTTKLNAAFVALAVTIILVVSGGRPQKALFDSLATDVIWLMIGAFVLGEAVKKTNLAARLTNLVVSKAGKVSQVFWLLTAALAILSFIIPSTSGRAAVAMPVFDSLSNRIGDAKVTRALSLLIPTIVLVSTICTLIGAGSHLIANDLLRQVSGQEISFLNWAIYGVPFGFAASAASCFVILRMFLGKNERVIKLEKAETKTAGKFSSAEWKTIVIAAVMVALWMTESIHHFEIALVTTVGALVLMMPGFGVMTWKDGLKAVSWNLVIFVGAALVLGKALIDTGAAQWIIENIFSLSGIDKSDPQYLILLTVAFISLTSHIYMTSHAARAAALVPAMLYFATSFELSPAAMVFISTVGMDYCLTFPVSSKAMLLFQELDSETFQPSDLLRLSAVLLIVHLVLMVAFYYGYWQFVGLKF